MGVCSWACLCVRVCIPCIGMWVFGCVCVGTCAKRNTAYGCYGNQGMACNYMSPWQLIIDRRPPSPWATSRRRRRRRKNYFEYIFILCAQTFSGDVYKSGQKMLTPPLSITAVQENYYYSRDADSISDLKRRRTFQIHQSARQSPAALSIEDETYFCSAPSPRRFSDITIPADL